jgi:glucose-specific phosphotransferase system IIA component
MSKFFSFSQLQKLGQSLMVPVSVLPGAGLVVALGRMMQINSMEGTTVTSPFLNAIGSIFYTSGLSIFENLPVIFAIGVAIGFSGGAGIAGLSAAAAYFTLTNLLKVMTDVRGLELAINTGVFGGIIAGLLAAYLYKKYHETRLHPIFGFFSGKRLVPILSMFFMVGVGLLLAYIWPPIQVAINDFGRSVTSSSLGPALYAAGKRLLIPVGLHHVYYPSFLFEFGEFVNAAGTVLKGDSTRYFAGDPNAGLFMASEFPIMLFGLPAAALAMVLRAKPEKRKAVAGVMISAALTSIVTGITEPIEFAFIFVAPLLFVLHVVLAFVSGMMTHAFDVHLGYTFSASVIDYVVGFFNQKNSLNLWIIIGPVIAALYFVGFYFLIPLFNFKTPGREDDENGDNGDSGMVANSGSFSKAHKVLQALGGAANIKALDACITRLRLTVGDMQKVNEAQLKTLGAAGMMKATGGSLQVIFGTESDLLKEEIKKIISSGVSCAEVAPSAKSGAPSSKNLVNGAQIEISSPIAGKLIPLTQVPDATFAQGLIGPGIAVEPSQNFITAPFDGKVVNLFHTNHAIGLESDLGVELLIHIGIDTVKMKGNGFKSFVKQGDVVKKGQKLIEFDLDLIKKEAKSIITPVIVTNGAQYAQLKFTTENECSSAKTLLYIQK